MRPATRKRELTVIRSLGEIPGFASESDEATYWDTHTFSDELWDQLDVPPESELPAVRPLADGRARRRRR